MPSLDRIVLNEYLSQTSTFRNAAITVDKIYSGFMNGAFKLVLGDSALQTRLRQLEQRVTELNNAITRSSRNDKKLFKEIDRLRLDITWLKNNLLEFLFDLRGRIHYYNGIFERYCNEYGLSIESNKKDKGILRWDHLSPDPATVLGSLNYIEDLWSELGNSRRKYQDNLHEICQDLQSLGMKTVPVSEHGNLDFQGIRSSVNQILNTVDILGLCDLVYSISKFFTLATRLTNIFPSTSVKLQLEKKSVESELAEFELEFEKSGRYALVLLDDVTMLANKAAEETNSIITNASEIDVGFESLSGIVRVLKRIKLCLPSARAFLDELSKNKDVKDTDFSEIYCKLMSRLPADLEHMPNYVATAGNFKNVRRELEGIFRA